MKKEKVKEKYLSSATSYRLLEKKEEKILIIHFSFKIYYIFWRINPDLDRIYLTDISIGDYIDSVIDSFVSLSAETFFAFIRRRKNFWATLLL